MGKVNQSDRVLIGAFFPDETAHAVRIAAANLNLSKSEWLRLLVDAGLSRPDIVKPAQPAQNTKRSGRNL